MTLSGGKSWWAGENAEPLLRAPPYPGSGRVILAEKAASGPARGAAEEASACIEAMRRLRVGGTFWAKQPALPDTPFIIARPTSADQARLMIGEAQERGAEILLWLPSESAAHLVEGNNATVIFGPCDPWHLFNGAGEIWLGEEDNLALLAAIAHCRVRLFGGGPNAHDLGATQDDLVECVRQRLLESYRYIEPFHGRGASALGIIRLLGQWRELIDANRPIRAAFGIAFWKRSAVEPLLWGGEGPVPFMPATSESLQAVGDGDIALWKARVPAAFLSEAERRSVPALEVEDGFIRSAGLGADCVPPLSIVVDSLCAHYDPSGPSGVENLLIKGDLPPELLARAEELRQLILSTGISKYGVGKANAHRLGGGRKHVLVTGQVEDDRSVLCGGGDVRSNLDLLRRVRALEPESWIIYRPHPDVDAGHRKGHIPDAEALTYADEIARDTPITALIDIADKVHVLTSLAGFEALLRGKPVTTHGVPFYAGWGLTTDLGPIPGRRNVRRSLTELTAVTLLLYPRYLDPITGLPCPPEVLIERLAVGVKKENSVIVLLRRLQGTLMRTMKGL